MFRSDIITTGLHCVFRAAEHNRICCKGALPPAPSSSQSQAESWSNMRQDRDGVESRLQFKVKMPFEAEGEMVWVHMKVLLGWGCRWAISCQEWRQGGLCNL